MNTFFISKKYNINDKVLDKYQSKAVICNKDKYLVIAGAGSGKTLTIVAKVKYLLENGFKENEILCISFTNETVKSLKELLIKNSMNVSVKTFHKLSLDILNRNCNISSSDLLEYVTNEYFESLIFFDNTYKLLEYIENIDEVKKTVVSFINQMKGLNYDINYLLNIISNNLINVDDKIILILIFKVYLVYEEELKSENKIDFNDMINLAIKKIDCINFFPYKYLIIDEYQDISECKYFLIKKLIDKFNLKLMAVGDDYQSIYSFTGCNLSLFVNFKKYFNNSKIIKLKNTYRNPNEITEVSKRMVMKNTNQINKRLKSSKFINQSIIIIYSNNEKEDVIKTIEDIDNIMILGRNNKDIEPYKDIINLKKNIKLLTVHKSKGLEEENIIILNVIDDVLGFPNKIKSYQVLSYLRNYNYLEEERRLFYVALTRAKNRVFIFTKKGKESIFVKELLKNYKWKIKVVDLTKKTLNNC